MNNLFRPWIHQIELFRRAAEIAGGNHVVEKLEEALSDLFHVDRRQVVLTCSGTIALNLLMQVRSTIWHVPAYGFVATINAVPQLARLRDIDPKTGWMLPGEGPSCPVAFAGCWHGRGRLADYLRASTGPVVLDAAGILGTAMGDYVHPLRDWRLGPGSRLQGIGLSFSATKLVSAGMGGAAIFGSANLAQRARLRISQGGAWSDPNGPGQTERPATNLRMGYWQAALVLSHLERRAELRDAAMECRRVYSEAYGPRSITSGPGAYQIVRTEQAREKHGKAGARWRFHRAIFNHTKWNFQRRTRGFPGAVEAERTYLYLPYGPGVTRQEAEKIIEQLGDIT